MIETLSLILTSKNFKKNFQTLSKLDAGSRSKGLISTYQNVLSHTYQKLPKKPLTPKNVFSYQKLSPSFCLLIPIIILIQILFIIFIFQYIFIIIIVPTHFFPFQHYISTSTLFYSNNFSIEITFFQVWTF